jgi:hypothetical protein
MIKQVVAAHVLVLVSLAGAYAGEPALKSPDCMLQDCHGGKPVAVQMSEGGALVKKFCTTCHTESRILDKLKAMHSDQHDSYEKSVKSIVVKKIRLTGGGITHRDGKKILEYLVGLYG